MDTETPHADGIPEMKKLHPAFYGCFDWHSAVHSHWAMLRALNHVDVLPEKPAIIETLSRHLTKENLENELGAIGTVEGDETPYGFGWGLRLAEELRRTDLPEALVWRGAYAPFERKLVEELRGYLANSDVPNRVGLHDNTAFAMTHMWDYAKTAGDEELRRFVEQRARKFYLGDKNCPLAREPAATDFLSPCFEEADLMRRVLPRGDFVSWYSRFLPRVKGKQLEPVLPKHPKDYFEVHLVGLMYSKASAMRAVAGELPPDQRGPLLEAAKRQVEAADKLIFDSGYGGTHWLASFAIFYYTGAGR